MRPNLKKEITFIGVFSLAAGAMISSGIFILPGIAFSYAGPSVFISYFLAGAVALLGIFSMVELSTAMPRSGGDCFYITRTLGPLMGTISGLWSWFAITLKTAFAIFGISEIIFIVSGIPVSASAPFVCAFFVILNLVGVKEVVRVQVILVAVLLTLMAGYITLGFPKVEESVFLPFAPNGAGRIFETAGIVFISFGGLLNIASVSGEIKNPKKNIPSGIIGAVITITVFYAAMLFVTVGVLPHTQLSGSLTPIADTARIIMGQSGYIAISIAALLAFVTTANAGIMSASRYPLVLSEDDLLPEIVSKISKKHSVPYVAIIITGILVLLALTMKLSLLVEAGSTVILATSVLTNVAVVILRASKIQNYRPSFRTPFYPVPQIISTLLFIVFIARMGHGAFEVSLTIGVIAILVYIFYGRKCKRSKCEKREYALLHILGRMSKKELTHNVVESELREILHERDGTKIDRLHELIAEAVIVDLKGPMELNDLFKSASEALSAELDMDATEIFALLKQGQEKYSTVITPFVAVPHIQIPGEGRFKILVARCSGGIRFSSTQNSVEAVFVIVSSADETNFALRTIASIGHIIQAQGFKTLWREAKNKQQIRDILLLSDRIR